MKNRNKYCQLFLLKKYCTVFIATSLLSVFAINTNAQSKNATNKKPNIIVILTDDMGFSDIGCYGSEINTPNIDRLAKNGVRFSHFYNTAR